ncbi:MAG: Fe-S cluster assembly protein SufD [Muribaculaceae bacterium]|nr:Fe-S cluster assembly protein SufD [Muribaculaceae bacterium]
MTAAESFGQYLEIVRAHGGSKCPKAVEGVVREATERLPRAIEAYRHDPEDLDSCRADRIYAPDYAVNLDGVTMNADVAASFHCGVPQLNSLLCVYVNDSVHIPCAGKLPAGLEIYPLRELPEEYHADAAALAKNTSDSPAGLIDTMLMTDGFYIRVAAGAVIDKPLQIVNIFNSTMPLYTSRHILVHALENSQVKILLCDHSQTPQTAHLNAETVRVVADNGSKVELYDIEESSPATSRRWLLEATQHDSSNLTVCTAFLRGGITRNEYRINVVGDGADTSLSGLAICTGSQIADNRVTLVHRGRHCRSRQLFKNAMFDESTGAFGGKIIVEEGAEATDAVQTNRNMLASPSARMLTAPQLEIYCDDVKCGHGATTGQLDERALFYMQSRGIPRHEATMMLTQAFMSDVVDNISFEVLRQRLHVLVEKRLNGTSGSCDTCAAACRTNISKEEQ